jgi:outer membrane lipoprotein-sorting protein
MIFKPSDGEKQQIMKTIFISLLAGLIALQSFSQGNPTAREVIEKSREVSKIAGMETVSSLKIFDNKGNERVRQMTMASRIYDQGATEKRIIRFQSPADVKGTGMLIVDYQDKEDDMWIYMPALKKTRRIVSGEKNKSFMGSEFSNADMAAPTMEDFTYKMLGSEQADGTDCWKIELSPASADIADEFGFSRKITWIGKQDYVPRKTEYYDLDNELWKVLNASEVKVIDPANKKALASMMEMVNKQSGRRSVFILEQVQFSPSVKDEYFTIAWLERI